MATAVNGKHFQRVFGRTPQTKILDQVWTHKDDGINIRELSEAVGNSYVYTVNLVRELADHDLVLKETVGREAIVRPNPRSPVIRGIIG